MTEMQAGSSPRSANDHQQQRHHRNTPPICCRHGPLTCRTQQMSHTLPPNGRQSVQHLPTGTPNQPTLRPKLAHCLRPKKGSRAEFVNIAGACLREKCEFYPSDVSTAVLTSTDQVLPVPSSKTAWRRSSRYASNLAALDEGRRLPVPDFGVVRSEFEDPRKVSSGFAEAPMLRVAGAAGPARVCF